VRYLIVAIMLAAGAFVVGAGLAFADASGDPAAVKNEDGKYYDKAGNPTYKVQSDGMVDWFTYSGFRRYHSDCHVCHGPDGEGSSYAPALGNSLKTVSYSDFATVVVNAREQAALSALAPSARVEVVPCGVDVDYLRPPAPPTSSRESASPWSASPAPTAPSTRPT